MYYMETISLYLSTQQINTDNNPATYYQTTFRNSIGIIENNRTIITWNIDMEKLLGKYFISHNTFKIEWVQMMTQQRAGGSPFANNNNYKGMQLYMEGLDFINCNYNQRKISNRNKVVIGSLSFPPTYTTTGLNLFNNDSDLARSNNIFFNKTNSNIQLIITLASYADSNNEIIPSSAVTATGQVMQGFHMKFNIIPIE